MGLMGLVSFMWPMAMAEKAREYEILIGFLLGNRRVAKRPRRYEGSVPAIKGKARVVFGDLTRVCT